MSRGQQQIQVYGLRPSQIGLPYVRFSAERLRRGGTSDGASISSWPGMGSVAVDGSATDVRRPTFALNDAAFGNRAVVSFDGTTDEIDVTTLITALALSDSASPFSVLAVLSYTDTSGAPTYFSTGHATANEQGHQLRTSNAGLLSQRRWYNAGTEKTITSDTTISTGTPHVRVDVFSGTTGAGWLDETAAGNWSPSNDLDVTAAAINVATIGAFRRFGNSNLFVGKIAELIVFAGALTSLQAVGLSRWARREYRLATF